MKKELIDKWNKVQPDCWCKKSKVIWVQIKRRVGWEWEQQRQTSNHCCQSTSNIATRSLIKSPPITLTSLSVFLIWSTSNHCRRSTSNHCHTKPDQIAAGQLAYFSLFDQWVSGWVGDDLAFGLSGFQLEWVFDVEWFSDLLLVWSWMVRRSR